ncbi:MAG TPA: glycine cleavage T C-terminal barrel domain-containing protein [Solirubrobacterales bacterium]|nr:glycine cleavage T C-terminal barrel domain-containing protein [Solirubrobacterales bacterium]
MADAAGTGAVAILELDAQYRQLREECGLFDRSARGKLVLSGQDVAEYLQGQLTNDVEALAPGEGCYAALLDRKGHIQADMRVLHLSGAPYVSQRHIRRTGSKEGEGFWLDMEPEGSETARRHLAMYKIGREVEVDDVTAEAAILSLIGPRSAEVAGAPPLPEHACEALTAHGVECLAVGTAGGVDLIAPRDEAERLRGALIAAGAVEVDAEAVEVLRIEAGIPRFGAEMGAETMPAEAGIVERAVSFEKGCYIGQEPVARLHYRGRPNRRLLGLRLSAPAAAGEALRLGEREVGRIGSACVSPAFGPIALAIVRREAKPGDELAVGEAGVTARVVELPFG